MQLRSHEGLGGLPAPLSPVHLLGGQDMFETLLRWLAFVSKLCAFTTTSLQKYQQRSVTLRSVLKKVESLAPLLAGQWGHEGTRYWQRRADGTWREAWTHRGGWQGARLTQVCFAIDLEVALGKVGFDQQVQRIGIADDLYLVVDEGKQAERWEKFEEVLAFHGHRLRRGKCATYCPA